MSKKKNLKKKVKRQAPVIESLEPRIMMSADLPGLDTLGIAPDDPLDVDLDRILAQAEEALLSASNGVDTGSAESEPEVPAVVPAEEPEVLLPSSELPDDVRRELIIVDPSVPDYEILLAGVNAMGGEDTRLDVVMLDPESSGIEQLSEILAARSDLDAIHLISHGSDGVIQMAGDSIDLALVQREANTFRAWGDALSNQGDILIYGCNLATTADGEALVDTLALLTGADVAASDDPTGNAALGGDWDLEYRHGLIEKSVAISVDAQQIYEGLLAAPVDLLVVSTTEGGASLNEDGGNDVYFVADDGAGLLGGLTTLTVEASFSVDTPAADNTVLLSYADGANDEELALFLKNDGSIWFHVHSNGSSGQLTTNQYPELLDGKIHHVGVSWDSTNGAVVFYIDGQEVESFTGYQTGQMITGTGELVIGQDQDSVLGGFNTIDVFSGTLYDVRIFNDVRTAGEITSGYGQTLPNTEPGMIANWTFDDMSTVGVVTDTVSGNNLTVQHVGAGGGFVTSTSELTLEVTENATNGTVVGSVAAVDPDTGDTFTYSLLDDAGGRFAINGSNGQITLVNASLLDFESAVSHNITVRVGDAGGLTYDEVFTVAVVDANDAPTFIGGSVGYWYFDEGSGDSTAESAIGISIGNLGSTAGADANDPTWTTGKFGQALHFDGVDDYVEIADAPELDISGPEFSASLWVKPDRNPGTEDMFFMKGDRQGIGNVNYYLSWKDTGKMTWAFKSDGGFEYLDMDVTLPTLNEWNHVAVVFDRPTVSIYINGTEYTSSVGTGGTSMDKDLVANDEPLWIGAGRNGGVLVTPGNYSAPFSGAIDEFAIFDRALTAAEIETIRTSQPAAATASAFTIDENSANSTVVGTVAASDQDAGDTLSYSITGGNTGGAFAIGANGTITVANSAALDFETNPTFTLTIEATDDGTPNESDTTSVSITLNDVNDAPVARPDGVHLSFDGDDFVEVADHPSLQMTNKVTMEAWINPDGTGTGSKIIVNKEGEYELGITADTGEIKFAIARPDNTWAWHNTGYFAAAGEWTHVAVTYDGVAGEAKTYINGELVDTFSQSGVIGDVYAGLNNLWIGGRENDPLDRFHGQIDDVRVWSTTRTLGEIQANKDGQLGGAEVGLVGNWRLDEAAGGAVVDQSAFGNDGVLGGSEGATAIPSYQGYVTDQNTVLNIAAGAGVLANDTDVDSGSLTVTNLDTTGMLGNLVLNTADGSFSYDPNGAFDYLDVGEQATETFTYTANDGSLDSNTVTATITITGVNDTPITSGIADVTVAEDAVDTVVDLFAAFADVEDLDPALTYAITTNTNSSLFTATPIDGVAGSLTLDYAPSTNGTADITLRATDSGGLWVESTFTVTVTAANDTPTTSGLVDVTVAEDAVDTVVDLFAAFADVEDPDPALSYTITTNTNSSLFTSTPIDGVAGTLTLDYAPDANGTADITVRATDSGGLWVESTFTVTVGAVNDAPVNHLTPQPETVASSSVDGATDIHAADLNGDGDIDLVSSSYGDDSIVWYENDGAGNLTAIDVATGVLGAREVFVADVDNDGHMDILSAAYEQQSVIWYENDGAGPGGTPTFTAHTIALGEGQASTVFAADLDNDGDTDVLAGYQDTDEVVWYENDGLSFTRNVITNATNGVKSVVAGDLDGDGDVDVAAVSYVGDTVDWFENDGAVDPAFSRHSVTTTLLGQMSMEIADVDGDGNNDLVVASYFDGKIAWYKNDGSPVAPTFSENIVSTSAAGARDVAIADLDADGDADIVAASYTENQFSWYENDGVASPAFVERAITLDAGGPRSVAVADMDGDLDLDVVGAAYTGDQVGFFENTDGSMGIQVTAEETPLTFNAANNNLISISDVDAGVGEMKVRLEITNGTLSLSGVVGLTLDVGAGTDDTVVEFRGSLLDINNALDGMVFTPTQDYVGNASIRILTDDQGNSGTGSALTDDDTINISVTPVNDDPVIISDGGGATASVNVAEAAKLVTTVVSSDVDGGAPTYSISGGNDQLLFDIDPVTGELTFKTLPDFENPTDTGTDNVYQVQVTVNDGNSGTYVQMINVTVTNRAPIANPDGPSSWFDETDGGAGYGSFGELVSAYDAFIGTTEQTVDLESLADATVLSNQFSVSHGVTFSNAGVGASGIYTEGTAWIENITGYDGSWAPDGSKVYLKMGNDVPGTPFTIDFDTPVAKVGALIGMGKEGTNHSVIVSLYDSGGGLIDQQTLDAELWDATGTDQNYETLFGARYDTAIISKIEILNASNVNYANALIFDQLTWSHTPDAGYVFDASAAVPLVTGNVLANDVDPAGGTLTFVGFTQPANGSVAYNGDGTFTYTSDPGYTGVDTFNYTVSDDDGLTDTATVAIQVSNAAPTISSDGGGANAALNVSENTTGVTTVTANDPDGHTPTFSITGGVDSALFDIDANSGDLTFKMAPDYENPGDTGTNNVYDVQVTAADGHGGFDTQTISITVTDSNDAPVARPDGVHLSFDGNDFVQIADHASLQMTNKVTMEAWINPTGTGTGSQLILNKEGEYELGIIADTGEIIFAIADSGNTWAWHYTGQFVTTGEWSHIAVAYDGVAGEAKTYINGQLVDTYAQSGVIGDAYPTFNDLTIGGRGNDAFERFEGRIDEVRVWSTTRTPGEIQSSMDGQLSGAEIGLAGNWRLDEAAGGAVLDQSAFGNDGVLGGSEGAAATPSYQGYITDQSTVLNIAAGAGVLANDLDDDGDGLTVTNLDTTGMLGNLVLNTADGSFSYDPNGAFDYLDVGEQATETFTYTANDGSLDSNTVTATITIMGVEDAPVITATNTGTVAEDGTLIANGTLAITDIDTNDNPIDFPDEASILGDSGFGDFQLVGGTWTYTLNNAHASVQALDAGQSLTDTHTFTASDGTSTQLVTVTINGAEDAPTLDNAIVDQVATEDVAFSFTFASNTFGDLDTSDSFSFAATLSDGITPLPAWLSFVDNGDGTGTFSGTPSNPDVGSISVMVTADDGSSTVSDIFDITVNNANDPPVFGGTNTGSVTEDIDPDVDTLLETSGVLTIADPDAGESSFQAATIGGTYGSLTIDVAGNWSYEADNTQAAIQALDAGQSVNDVLTVSAFDGTTHNVTITINGAEDAPIITATSAGTVAEDGTLTANGTLAITDVDTNDNPIDFPDEASTLGDSGFGDFQLVGGTWTYTLNNAHASVQALDVGQSLTDAHTFTASDGTSTQLVTITINGAEDAPIITATSAGTVAEDGTLTANGTLAITDVDTNDNPIDFPDEASTLGDNGYGDFQLVGGTWTYTLNNASPVVQALDAGDAVSDTHTFTASDGTSTQVVTITITGTEDTPVIGGVSTGAVTEDVDPDLDTLLEAAGTLTITDADAGESNFVAGSVAGSHGNLIIDASGNWDYEADNTQATIQQLDAGESVNDILTVTTADGTSHNVTVTINGGEDAPLIGGVMAGAVVKDGTLVANGALSITDVDTSDNPVSFPDAASTPGDNGYGDFQLTAGSWSYTLNNGHAAVHALGAGASLTDTHIFTASDGSTQLVSIAIAGAAETVPSPVAEPPPPAPTPEPPPFEPPPEPEEDPIDPPVEEEPDPEEPLPAGRTDPSAGEAETGDPLVDGQNSVLLKPLEPGEVFLSVIADARPDDAPGIERISAPVAKPDAASAQTFLQELKSFWQEESTNSSVEISEVRFNQQFWDGLDKMASDLDESVEEQDKQMQLSAEAAAGVGVSLTAGFVSWALRAGSMAASFLAAMPTWRHFDPMPVLVEDKKKNDSTAGEPDDESESSQKQEENSLDDLFDR